MAESKVASLAEDALRFLFNADNLTLEKITSIAKNVRRLATSIQTETQRVKNFKFDIRWKTRVINVPIAVDHFKDLLHELTDGLHDKILDLEKPFTTFVHDLKLITQTPEIDPQISKLSRSFSELENFITQLNILVGEIDTALQSSLSLTSLFDRVIDDLEHLEDVFLSQKSTRDKTTVTYFKRNA